LLELAQGGTFNVGETPHAPKSEQGPGVIVLE